MPYGLDNLVVRPEVLRRASTGHDEAVVVRGVDFVERRGQFEVVAPLLEVRLVAPEVVDGRLDGVPRLLLRADGVDLVADRL